MKKIIAMVLLLMFGLASAAFAEVTAEIVAKDLDDNGNIRVWTQYKIDGVEVASKYPKLDGKYYLVTRYNNLNFVGMNDTEIKARITEDLQQHCKTLTMRKFIEVNNTDIHDNHLRTLVGTTSNVKDTKIQIDADGDGINDKEWTIKTDGTHTESVITP